MKKILAFWIATLLILGFRLWNYLSITRIYAAKVDKQSIQTYQHADDMAALYLAIFIAVFIIGVVVIASNLWYQQYREVHPKPPALKNAEYWDKVGWLWLVGFFLALVASCATMTLNLPLGVLGLVPSAYLLYRSLACLALSDELKRTSLAPGPYSPREHPI